MDGAPKSKRLYPAYTLAELEAIVTKGEGHAAMIGEIAARKSGKSVTFKVPQILGV